MKNEGVHSHVLPGDISWLPPIFFEHFGGDANHCRLKSDLVCRDDFAGSDHTHQANPVKWIIPTDFHSRLQAPLLNVDAANMKVEGGKKMESCPSVSYIFVMAESILFATCRDFNLIPPSPPPPHTNTHTHFSLSPPPPPPPTPLSALLVHFTSFLSKTPTQLFSRAYVCLFFV